MKAFYVIVMLTNWHGHTEQHVQNAGWMIEHQCHLKAHWLAEQHPHIAKFNGITGDNSRYAERR